MWQDSPQHPSNIIPSSTSSGKPDLHRQTEKRTTESDGSKSCGNSIACCLDEDVALTRGGVHPSEGCQL